MLAALISAGLLAGCTAASQPAPGTPSAGTTATTSSSPAPQVSAPLDLCRPTDLAPARALSTPGYAQLAVSVTNAEGEPISGLKQTDFTVRSGAKPAPIVYFRQESSLTTPVSLVIVGDVSGSMYRKTVVFSPDEVARVRSGLNQAASQLNECDEVALVLIGGTYQSVNQPPLGEVTLAQPFTTSHSLALEKIYSVMPSGEKRLSDGIRVGLETLSGAHYPNRAMVLLTDGLDQAAIDQAAPILAQVRNSGISFWVVGIGDPEAHDGIVSKLRGSVRLDAGAVKKLADEGGGWVLSAKPVESDDGASLAAAVATINKQLGEGYALGVGASPGGAAPVVSLPNNSAAMVRAELVPSEVLAAAVARPAEPKWEVGTSKIVEAPENISNLAGYTEIAATVAKPDGSPVDGLSKSDFKLAVSGTPQAIDFFHAGENSPATVGILVDTSGSMVTKLPQARAAIEQFVKTLNPQDEVFLFAFSTQPFILQPLTNDHAALIQKLDMLHAYGQTALFDSILQGISEAQGGHNQRKVLLVITDGMDNTSSSSADDVLRAVASSGVLVYSIGIGNPKLPPGGIVVGPFVMGGDDAEHVDAVTLSRLASASGSKSYIVPVDDVPALNKACEEIADDLHLRHSYAIGFVAHAPSNYAPTTIPIALQVPAHDDYLVDAPKWIPAPSPQ
ncbi:MAG: VWA domain-containing protein [Candidatus Binatus sp.]|jgi:VWFA-related protein